MKAPSAVRVRTKWATAKQIYSQVPSVTVPLEE